MGKYLNQIVGSTYFQHLKTLVSSLNRGITRSSAHAHYKQLAEIETDKVMEKWQNSASIELFESVSYLTHCIIVHCLMGPDFREHADEMFDLLHTMEANLGSIWNFLLPRWVPHPAARRLWAARDRMEVIFRERLNERKKTPERWSDAGDYISFTLSDPTTQHLEQFYAAHHTVLMFAAHTSTVALISWTMVEVSPNPPDAGYVYCIGPNFSFSSLPPAFLPPDMEKQNHEPTQNSVALSVASPPSHPA